MARRLPTRLASALLALFAGPVGAVDYRSVAPRAAVLFDAPSEKAKPLSIVTQYYPVEVMVVLSGWTKVRGQDGTLAWIDSRLLAKARTVVVVREGASVHEKPDPSSPVLFSAGKNVALDVVEDGGRFPGWVKVRHKSGGVGYILVSHVWGT